MSYIVAVDSGGTFSDCVAVEEGGEITRAKSPSTPPDFERGVLNAATEVARKLDMSLEELLGQTTVFAHGTTVATNILITRTGAKAALITTAGHEDAILIGRTVQKVAGLAEAEIINVAELTKADPVVPRSRIFGLNERVDRAGEEICAVDLDQLRRLAGRLRDEGVESIAVSFLWSFLNPEHEDQARDLLAQLGQENGSDWFVTAGSDIAPVMREYERTSTAVLNSYLTPGVRGYLERMQSQLRESGHKGGVAIMHSGGGVNSVDEAKDRGVTLLSSGPAGGMLGTKDLARRLGLETVIATDVGGTSFDIGVIIDGEPVYAEMPVFSKYPVAVPVIDVASIGAGGGSIAWIEESTGVLKVGPQSAGASPGPVCYGAGGTEPTVTDANVVLGRINPEYFLGGRMTLDAEGSREAIRTKIADPMGISPEEAAAAVITIVNSQMADLIRKVTVERGMDPSSFSVFAYGGAAGLHVGAYAGRLDCREVVIPRAAAVFSAFGIGMSDVKRIGMASAPERAPFALAEWIEKFGKLDRETRADLERENLPTTNVESRWFVDLQFRGQVHTVRVPVERELLELDDGGDRIIERFVELYEAKYGKGSAYVMAGVEAMTFVVEAIAGMPIPDLEEAESEGPDAGAALSGSRQVYLPETGSHEEVRTYNAEKLRPGNVVTGPAMVEAEDTTILVDPGLELGVDGLGNLRMRSAG